MPKILKVKVWKKSLAALWLVALTLAPPLHRATCNQNKKLTAMLGEAIAPEKGKGKEMQYAGGNQNHVTIAMWLKLKLRLQLW